MPNSFPWCGQTGVRNHLSRRIEPIRAHFGLPKNPFAAESLTLLAHQQEIFDILKVHAQQGGLCLVLGEPGTGKSVLKDALLAHDPKRLITPVVNRTLHTYHNTLRILCAAFQIEFNGQKRHRSTGWPRSCFFCHPCFADPRSPEFLTTGGTDERPDK